MIRALVFAAGFLVAGAAGAQYKWTDQNGRVQYGDMPPPGVNAAPMRRAPAPLPQAEPSDKKDDAKDAKDAKDVKKGPLTPAEQDAAFRKRQQEAEKDREKQAKAQQQAEEKKDNCRRAQENARALEAGRVVRTDAKGENYFPDDAQVAQEKSRAQRLVQEWCN